MATIEAAPTTLPTPETYKLPPDADLVIRRTICSANGSKYKRSIRLMGFVQHELHLSPEEVIIVESAYDKKQQLVNLLFQLNESTQSGTIWTQENQLEGEDQVYTAPTPMSSEDYQWAAWVFYDMVENGLQQPMRTASDEAH